MKRIAVLVTILMVGSMLAMVGGAQGARKPSRSTRLDLYTTTVRAQALQELVSGGFDITAVEPTARGAQVDLVLDPQERDEVEKLGTDVRLLRNKQGRTQRQLSAAQAQAGYEVFRDYDGRDGLARWMRRLARRHPGIAELHTIGTSHQGRPIYAIRVTKGVADVEMGQRPAALYQGTHHAREWISTEVTRRLLRWFVTGYRSNNTIRNILADTELWFAPIMNPDGYQYTFEEERLWRKNLRDNNGNNTIDGSDGVDLNRNFPNHWNYDEEGSSGDISNLTYRGPSPASEPETQANISLFDMADFRFAISYHSYGQLLLYPQGWQTQTPSADDPIYVALTGTDERPAVRGFDPDVSAELYTTNGEYSDWAHGDRGVLAWIPELSEGCEGCGFVFPDNARKVRREFRKNINFAVRVAKSAPDPDDPVSHMGIDTKDFYLDTTKLDPHKGGNPLSDLTFKTSYAGNGTQPVEVLAKRSAGDVTLHYRINGGSVQTAPTSESPEGERYGGNNAYNNYYHYLQGQIPTSRGDSVRYWFSAGDSTSARSTFEVVGHVDENAEVLLVGNEDRTGQTNIPEYESTDPDKPNYAHYYRAALSANNISFDNYDIDRQGRVAPDQLGVMSHYDAVVWYTGNNLVTREPEWGPGNVSRLHNDVTLEMREYLNRGGKLLSTGQWAGALENGLAGGQYYDPVANEQCVVDGELVVASCQYLADKNDFLQYYLGSYIYNSDAGTDEEGNPLPVVGVGNPYSGARWEFNGATSAGNQVHTASHVSTSSILPEDEYPQFASDAPAQWQGAGGSFEPIDGQWYMYSQRADITYKRLMREIDLSGTSAGDDPSLSFQFSYDTEPDWDYVFVEVHTVGKNDWTTLPEVGGATGQDTGASCPEGWFELHPWLERYQGEDCSGSNPSTGGEWNAASGRSPGWTQWEFDLSDYAGEEIEVSISYASDWSTQGLGAFVDQIEVSTGEGSTSFEDGTAGWTVAGPPQGSADNPNDWIRTQSVNLEEGAVVSTDDTLFFGFGFEGINGAAKRAAVMRRSIGYLLP